MKYLLVVLLALALALPALSANTYFGAEVYPNSDLFLLGGLVDNCFKVDFWGYPGSEVGGTAGWYFGDLALGIGGSAGPIGGRNQFIYLNADLTFSAKLGPWNWTNYNLFQSGLHGTNDVFISRNNLTIPHRAIGGINHIVKSEGNDWKVYTGLSIQLGNWSGLSSNSINVAPNFFNGEDVWVAWIFKF